MLVLSCGVAVITLTFSDVDLDFAEVEMVDVVGRDSLDADEPAPDGVPARQVGGPRWTDGSRMIAAEAVQLGRRAADTHFDISHSIHCMYGPAHTTTLSSTLHFIDYRYYYTASHPYLIDADHCCYT